MPSNTFAIGQKVHFTSASGNGPQAVYTISAIEILQGTTFYRLEELPGALVNPVVLVAA
jgi:hypothetical protein